MASDFEATRAKFHLPDGVVYLDGNSLGPLPVAAAARIGAVAEKEWGEWLISGWNRAGWMEQPRRIGDAIGRLIGAPAGTVTLGDTLTIKVFQALDAALQLNPDRNVILSDNGNFPSDIYAAQGLAGLRRDVEVRLVPPEDVLGALDEHVGVLLLTEVDYRTGKRHDMSAVTAAAHEQGIVTVWNLAHSAGAIPVDLAGARADFAVGCTYKYLNGGPGAPGFLYASEGLADRVRPGLAGWLGHARPFAFELDYDPAPGIDRMRVGTPPVLQMAALECALDIWNGIDMGDARARSIELSEQFRLGVADRCPDLRLASPADPAARGSQLSFHHPEGYAVMQALIARGVIGDFRAPDLLRFGFAPLYNTPAEIAQALDVLETVLNDRLWDRVEYKVRAAVT